MHEANLSGGVGAEIAAYISENFFESLDAPVVRVASLDTPVPFSENIERDIYLPLSRIKDKINYLLDY
jgi:2-oxoisovalerate dehydrogenase E1 component